MYKCSLNGSLIQTKIIHQATIIFRGSLDINSFIGIRDSSLKQESYSRKTSSKKNMQIVQLSENMYEKAKIWTKNYMENKKNSMSL